MRLVWRQIGRERYVLADHRRGPQLGSVGPAHADGLIHTLVRSATACHDRVFHADKGSTRHRIPYSAVARVGELSAGLEGDRIDSDEDAERRSGTAALARPDCGVGAKWADRVPA